MDKCVFIFLLSIPVTATTHKPTRNEILNNRPIIAILAELLPTNGNSSYIGASYVKYLEGAGARVVPVPHYFTSSQVEDIFSHVNGVLFPGGSTKLFTSAYYKHAKLFWEMAIDANDNDDFFPIWGTCLGFQTLHVIQTDSSKILSSRKAEDISMPLSYTPAASHSRLFNDISKGLFVAMGSDNLTYNHHGEGIDPKTYESNPKLKDFFKILSTNFDVNGKEFVSTVEAYEYPIYGTQWHPEKNNFEFTTLYKDIPHSSTAVKVSQYVANFFVDEARKSTHRFRTSKLEEEYMIYKYPPVHSAVTDKGLLAHFEQIYLF